MGNAFLLKKKILCDTCYWEEIEYLSGRGEIPPKRMVDAKECDKCHAVLDPEVLFSPDVCTQIVES